MQHDFILLDRSGSMADNSKWVEALSGINAYVKKLAEDKVDTGVTLVTFDKHNGNFMFEIIRDRITPATWHPITNQDAVPRGGTPLNDAVGRIVNLAGQGFNGVQYDKIAMIIVTDGEENASQELDHAAAKKLLDEGRAKGWQVIMLGANFDNAQQAATLGNAGGQTLNYSSRNTRRAFEETASSRSLFGSTGQDMSYTIAQKTELAKE